MRERRGIGRLALASASSLCVLIGAACTAGVRGTASIEVPDGGGAGGTAGTSVGTETPGNPFEHEPTGTMDAPAGPIDDGGSTAPACMEAKYSFVPKTPTVFLLVDQSGSMFSCRSAGGGAVGACANHADTSWYPLRDGVLQVVTELETQVRFGFSAFTGEMGDAVCPKLDPVPPALDNAAAIAARYDALVAPRKGETPTKNALASVGALLAADPAPGERFILFVTDGQPDYCDDGNPLCPPDSVVGELQTLAKSGIKTLVFGISSPLTTISDASLTAFANAGAGEPVAPLVANPNTLNDTCHGVAPWAADLAAAGKAAGPGQTVGDYSAAGGGQALVFKPDVANQQALVDAISAALSGVKSCVFDLGKLDGKAIKVDLTQLDQAHVLVSGVEIPRDDVNGWHMLSSTELELVGDACATWRKPENTTIDFRFPCKIIIIP